MNKQITLRETNQRLQRFSWTKLGDYFHPKKIYYTR